ncbi:hypothetical protein EHS25_006810 [Saitozyma podzolica]|jgi:hypothetical protein|uniref:Transmembrane protein n=1 Tax=Saitozyma podzolica TaxID=1890683 RepID=A0A427XRL0_9TREE|nr:hypothetical protein EHS25_006810 [Saitozyma podzolica]
MPNSAEDAVTAQDVEQNVADDKPKRVAIWRRPWVISASVGFVFGAPVGVLAVVFYAIKGTHSCGESTGEWSTF